MKQAHEPRKVGQADCLGGSGAETADGLAMR